MLRGEKLKREAEAAKPPLSLKELRKRRKEEADAAKGKDPGKDQGNPK